jgi:phage gp36-like protein
MAYATPSDLLARNDARIIGDLLYDNGVRINETDILTNDAVETALDDASGLVNSAAFVGGRYTAADLTGLTGADQSFLVRLTCNLAFILLVQRRGIDTSPYPQWADAQNTLQQLRFGERIFNVVGVQEAHNTTSGFMSAVEYADLNLAAFQASRYFNTRREQRFP